ncbi:MAG TPA: hypothetical protein VJQ44_16165 [Gemmatimonadales bacterium]|nr:hypothetical protein [Gemmatimonadales bacterium]
MRARAWLGAWSLAALAMAGCGGDDNNAFSPTVANVAGTYNATVFTAGTMNLLSAGATVRVVLNPDGTTTGHLHVPGGDEGGGDLDADLAGTWTLSGNTVTFSQSSDTFIKDVEFTAAQNSLDARGTVQGVAIHLALAKTG